jgi:hypothetical protein
MGGMGVALVWYGIAWSGMIAWLIGDEVGVAYTRDAARGFLEGMWNGWIVGRWELGHRYAVWCGVVWVSTLTQHGKAWR